MLVLGIDESGRGPCIGSMFIAGTLFDEKDDVRLKKMGVKDSKLLPHSKRLLLSKDIRRIAKGITVIKVLPKEIDDALEHHSLNLNWLEAVKQAMIINSLKPDRAIIDCPSPNRKAYEIFLRKRLTHNAELVVEHKADINFVFCSAASIIAKCERESEMDEIRKRYGNCGPGYTSNHTTQKFIKENFERYPEIFRKSWVSYRQLASSRKQKRLAGFT